MHSVCLLRCTDGSCTLSVTGPVNGRPGAGIRAAFVVVHGIAAASTEGAAAWQARHAVTVRMLCVSHVVCVLGRVLSFP